MLRTSACVGSTTLEKLTLSTEFIGMVAREIYPTRAQTGASLGHKLHQRSYKPLFDRLGKGDACELLLI